MKDRVMSKTNAEHVAIIMDGNGRWAKERGLPRSMGHKKGLEAVEKAIEYARANGVKVLSLYAFSTENWNRSETEISFLFSAFKDYLNKRKDKLMKNGIRLLISGRREGLGEDLLRTIDSVEEYTQNASDMILNICFNYGGKSEIVDAVRNIAKQISSSELSCDEIDDELLESNFYNKLPEIDLLIRTSGECRLSNFMLWQAAYAEFFFTEQKWPDFDERSFEGAVLEYKNRNRRYGAEA